LPQAQINQFQGGKLALRIEGNWSPFGFATNTGARGAMSSVTTLYPSASSWFGNPAALADLKGLSTQADFFLPGLGLGVSSERTKLLRQNLRLPIQDFLSSGDNHVDDPVYPDIDMSLYQSTNVSGFNLAWGTGKFAFGAGVQQPLKGVIDFSAGGLRLGLAMPEDDSDPASDSVKVLLAGDVIGRMHATLEDFAVGLASQPKPWLKIGFTFHRYVANIDVDGQARLDGVLQRAGQETFFNDPAALYQDDLDAQSRGEIEGGANGFRFGLAWDIRDYLGLDVAAGLSESMLMRGQVHSEYHMLPAVDPASSEIFSMDNLNLTKLTLTQKFSSTMDSVRILLPWDLAASLRTSLGMVKINLDYTYFLRDLGIAYNMEESEDVYDKETKDFRLNAEGGDSVATTGHRESYRVSLRQQVALGLQIDQVWIHLGLLDYRFRQPLIDEAAAWKPDFLPFVPTLNMGYFFPIGPRFNVTVSLLAFPVSLFKTSVEYRY